MTHTKKHSHHGPTNLEKSLANFFAGTIIAIFRTILTIFSLIFGLLSTIAG